MADRGLGAALAEVNSAYAVGHLYRVTRGSVSRVSLQRLYPFSIFLQVVIAALDFIYGVAVVLGDYDTYHMMYARLFPWA